MSDERKNKVHALPEEPGVYLLKDARGRIIYVGKAKNLRKRVSSYLSIRDDDEAKTKNLKALWRDLDYIAVTSEVEALFAEQNYIKRHYPKFNILLKDDKKYVYIRITEEEDYPRIFMTRNLQTKKTTYIGPFMQVRNVQATLKLLRKIFQFRTCNGLLFKICAKRNRACLDFHIKLCTGPCVGHIEKQSYKERIKACKRFLLGYEDELIKSLKQQMMAHASQEQFEAAGVLRDQITALESVVNQRQQAIMKEKIDADVFAIAVDAEMAAGQVLHIRQGRLQNSQKLSLENTSGEAKETILQQAILQFYKSSLSMPPVIFTPFSIPDEEMLLAYLEDMRKDVQKRALLFSDDPDSVLHTQRKLSLQVPQAGAKKKLTGIAQKNADEYLQQMHRKKTEENQELLLSSLQEVLDLPTLPERIECYDISHLGGTHTVGSMIVFEQGKAKKAHYRKFAIREETNSNDYAALQEMVSRRLARLQPDEKDASFSQTPDLMLIDGGKGQLSAVLEIAKQFEVNFAIASIAKREEELFLPDNPISIRLEKSSPVLHLVQRIRDEAHRFAVGFQRKKREG